MCWTKKLTDRTNRATRNAGRRGNFSKLPTAPHVLVGVCSFYNVYRCVAFEHVLVSRSIHARLVDFKTYIFHLFSEFEEKKINIVFTNK